MIEPPEDLSWETKTDAFFRMARLDPLRPSIELEEKIRGRLTALALNEFWSLLAVHTKDLHRARGDFMTEWFDCKPVSSFLYDALKLQAPETLAALDQMADGPRPNGPYDMARAQLHIRHKEFDAAIARLEKAERFRKMDPAIQQLILRCRRAVAGHDFFENQFADLLCHFPFEEAFLQEGGAVVPCCSTSYMPYTIGNAFRDDMTTMWTGDKAREIRESILDGSYRYCNPKVCHLLATRSLMVRSRIQGGDAAVRQRFPADGHAYPKAIGLLHDTSCNLECRMCRDGLQVASADQVRVYRSIEPMLLEWIHNALSLHISGSGEPLASRHFRNLLGAINKPPYAVRPGFVLKFLTHGLMFDRKFWQTHPNLHSLRIILLLSIDAAEKGPYEKIRTGGDFDVLRRNLEFISGLRRSGQIETVRLQFAVQADNADQLVPFVKMCLDYGFDAIHFLPLQKRTHYAADVYARDNVCDARHPLHGQLLDQLNDPIMLNPIVARTNSIWALPGAKAVS